MVNAYRFKSNSDADILIIITAENPETEPDKLDFGGWRGSSIKTLVMNNIKSS